MDISSEIKSHKLVEEAIELIFEEDFLCKDKFETEIVLDVLVDGHLHLRACGSNATVTKKFNQFRRTFCHQMFLES